MGPTDGENPMGPLNETPLNTPTMVRGPEQYYGAPRTSGVAIASLVLGILSIFFTLLTAIPGLVLGIVALCQIKGSRRQFTGAGFAVAGIALSVLMPLMLAALLAPVFMQARERARQVSCESNLKEISVATLMYTQDYDEHLPPAAHWTNVIFPYVQNRVLFKCSDDNSGSRSSYAFNSAVGGLPLKAVGDPANTVGVFEAHSNWDVAGSADLLAFRHEGGANVGFADGHVKLTRADSVSSLEWKPRQSGESQAPSGP